MEQVEERDRRDGVVQGSMTRMVRPAERFTSASVCGGRGQIQADAADLVMASGVAKLVWTGSADDCLQARRSSIWAISLLVSGP